VADLDPRLSEENVQKVIERALALQSETADALTETQVREIAAELAIPESMLEQALAELRAATASAAPTTMSEAAAAGKPWRRRRTSRTLMLLFAFAGVAFALVVLLSLITRL
jgi:ferric-dicitrate binding protein FerR (iron transport regulator)